MAGFRGTSTYDLFQLYFQIQDNTEVARKCFEISHCRVSMLVQLQGLVEAIMFCTSGLAAIGGLEVAFVAAVVHRSVVHRLPAAAWTVLGRPDVSHLKVTSRHVVAVKGFFLAGFAFFDFGASESEPEPAFFFGAGFFFSALGALGFGAALGFAAAVFLGL